MPVVRISCPLGSLSREQKAQIAESLTQIVLDVEVDAVTDAGRMVTVVQFHEAAPENWAVGGQLRSPDASGPNHFIVELIVLQGLLDGSRRTDAHRRVTQAFADALGAADPLAMMRVWVLIHEVREGSWGAGGMTVSALDVASFLSADLSAARRDEITAALAPKLA